MCGSDVYNLKILKGLLLFDHLGVVQESLDNKDSSRNNHKLLCVLHSRDPGLFNFQRLHLQETFDHVISYASIYHLEKDEQCHWAEKTSSWERIKAVQQGRCCLHGQWKRQKLQLFRWSARFVLLIPPLCLLQSRIRSLWFHSSC